MQYAIYWLSLDLFPPRTLNMQSTQTVAPTDSEKTDQDAIALMLAYVEAECRRLGAEGAARHAALAAAMLPCPGLPVGARLH